MYLPLPAATVSKFPGSSWWREKRSWSAEGAEDVEMCCSVDVLWLYLGQPSATSGKEQGNSC